MTPEQQAHIMALVSEYAQLMSASFKDYGALNAKWKAIEAALRDAPQAEGWVMVPVEPTKEMIAAANKVDWSNEDCDGTVHNAWNSMLAATPSAPTAVGPVGCLRCVTPQKCAVHGCCPNTWPSEKATPSATTAVEPDERAALSEMIDSYALAFHAAIVRPESHEKMKAKAESIKDAILERALATDTPSREDQMVVVRRNDQGTPTVWCDPEIVDLVTALNDAGIETVASCSGHGERSGIISLKDGRQLMIAAARASKGTK